MAWNFMQTEVIPADMLVLPMIGPGGLTREAARVEIQSILDRMTGIRPEFERIARTWRDGAKDDVAYAGPFGWTIYEHPDGEDPRRAAMAWLEDYAERIRAAGIPNVQIARLPD